MVRFRSSLYQTLANILSDAAWSTGILITSGSQTIEKLAEVSHIVLDKTGTLTEGRLRVTATQFADDAPSIDTCCRLLAASEVAHAQEHPVARAVFQWALQNLDIDRRSFEETTNVRARHSVLGKGVRCEITTQEGQTYVVHVGNRRFMEENSVDTTSVNDAELTSSRTVVYFAFNEECVGHLILQVRYRLVKLFAITLTRDRILCERRHLLSSRH